MATIFPISNPAGDRRGINSTSAEWIFFQTDEGVFQRLQTPLTMLGTVKESQRALFGLGILSEVLQVFD